MRGGHLRLAKRERERELKNTSVQQQQLGILGCVGVGRWGDLFLLAFKGALNKKFVLTLSENLGSMRLARAWPVWSSTHHYHHNEHEQS